MTTLEIIVVGTVAAQGSKRHVGHGVMVEASKRVKPWRQDVKTAALAARDATGHQTLVGPVTIRIQFRFARPAYHYRTGRHAGQLKPNAPTSHHTRPDIEKCQRAVSDALTEAGVWRDDSQVCHAEATKTYTGPGQLPGAYIVVTSHHDDDPATTAAAAAVPPVQDRLL
ncbi:MAG: RusA family crossover junction endodeoxyribonuclease [Nocardioidaceae bacterium]